MSVNKDFYSVLKNYQIRNNYKKINEPTIMLNNDESLEKLLKFVIVPTAGFVSLIMTGVLLFALWLIYYALATYNPTIWDMLGSKAL
ncbi:MAG: hypothetical protein GWO78_00630 [Dehalococcoidales bacterium]|jgi:hypothetical protein|nr:hypothetical protein [Dehalococcoidales bacterium]